jgi:hypothetical protein
MSRRSRLNLSGIPGILFSAATTALPVFLPRTITGSILTGWPSRKKVKRSGTLWEGRFRSCLAQSDDYVLACYRYIELNPVRAERVRHPREYRWSSYRANAEGKMDELVSPHEEYRRLGREPTGPARGVSGAVQGASGLKR